jgi:hypothetical protein
MLYGHYAGNNKSFPDFVQKGENIMYGKQATINLIKSIIDYDSNTRWGSALRHAVKSIEESISSDDEFMEDATEEIYFTSNQRDLTKKEISNGIGKYIKDA